MRSTWLLALTFGPSSLASPFPLEWSHSSNAQPAKLTTRWVSVDSHAVQQSCRLARRGTQEPPQSTSSDRPGSRGQGAGVLGSVPIQVRASDSEPRSLPNDSQQARLRRRSVRSESQDSLGSDRNSSGASDWGRDQGIDREPHLLNAPQSRSLLPQAFIERDRRREGTRRSADLRTLTASTAPVNQNGQRRTVRRDEPEESPAGHVQRAPVVILHPDQPSIEGTAVFAAHLHPPPLTTSPDTITHMGQGNRQPVARQTPLRGNVQHQQVPPPSPPAPQQGEEAERTRHGRPRKVRLKHSIADDPRTLLELQQAEHGQRQTSNKSPLLLQSGLTEGPSKHKEKEHVPHSHHVTPGHQRAHEDRSAQPSEGVEKTRTESGQAKKGEHSPRGHGKDAQQARSDRKEPKKSDHGSQSVFKQLQRLQSEHPASQSKHPASQSKHQASQSTHQQAGPPRDLRTLVIDRKSGQKRQRAPRYAEADEYDKAVLSGAKAARKNASNISLARASSSREGHSRAQAQSRKRLFGPYGPDDNPDWERRKSTGGRSTPSKDPKGVPLRRGDHTRSWVQGFVQGTDKGRERGVEEGHGKGREAGLEEGHKMGFEQGFGQGRTHGHKAGLEEGHKNGLERGLAEGSSKAHESGVEEGRTQGHKVGFELGHKEGKEIGFQDGHTKGHEKGHEEGHEKGHLEGHRKGLKEGLEKGQDLGRTAGAKEGFKNGHETGFAEGHKQGRKCSLFPPFQAMYFRTCNVQCAWGLRCVSILLLPINTMTAGALSSLHHSLNHFSIRYGRYPGRAHERI